MPAWLVGIPVWLYAAAAALIAGFGGGWAVRDAFCDAAKADALEAVIKESDRQVKRMGDAASKLEDYRYESDQSEAVAQREIRTIYRDRVVRPDCDIDPASRRLLDRARDSANAAASGESGEAVQSVAANP